MNERVTREIRSLPERPGVYLMKDAGGRTFYIGKACNLRARVRAYLRPSGDNRAFVSLLDGMLDRVSFILTENDKEAVILEDRLVKLHRPKFNVSLRDDKSFLYLKLDEAERFPALELKRRPGPGERRVFGPYASAASARQTMRIIARHFGLRVCRPQSFRARLRPCIRHQMRRCLGPCCLPVSEEEYGRRAAEASLFLSGRRRELVRSLRAGMEAAAGALDFEEAARIRDQIEAVERTVERQHVVLRDAGDADAFGVAGAGGDFRVAVARVRDGSLIDTPVYTVRGSILPVPELLSGFLPDLYGRKGEAPDEVLLPCPIEDAAAIARWLEEKAGKAVSLLHPRRGERAALLRTAARNAEASLARETSAAADARGALQKLKDVLRLSRTPERMECCDVSTLRGDTPVGAIVVFRGGAADKSGYRLYGIKEAAGNDDFAMVREVITRRVRSALGEGGPLPDLLVIDGGRGQLAAAKVALERLGAPAIDVVSIAKKRRDRAGRVIPDRIFVNFAKQPIRFADGSPEMRLLCRIRDEAHRFVLSCHRRGRGRSRMTAGLDQVPGIGPSLRKALLGRFKSLEAISGATVEELCGVKGISRPVAEAVIEFLKINGY